MASHTTSSGIEEARIYTSGAFETLPDAGEFPFTRGIHSEMYRERPWTMRQYAGFSTAEESNKRYHYLLGQGTMGLSVAFDLPTQIGYDPDHSLSEGEVGKVGVSICSLKDMETLFAGIKLQDVTTSMTINATASTLLAFYVALAKRQGADLKAISGTIQNDILKEYAARGTYIYPPKPSMRIITDIFEYCSKELPKWNTISISGYHMREAGCTAVQEVAFTLANGIAYVKAAKEKGLDIDVFGRRLSFFFNAHNHFFEEIAKFRAARRLWAKLMVELGSKDQKAQTLRFHTQTGGSTLAAQQPMNNVARVTLQAMAAVLGGTQSLHTNGYDEALSLPTEVAAGLALKTQQVIAYESGATHTVDPMGGSYYVEALTDEIERAARVYINRIEEMGGSVKAIEAGYLQEEIAKASYQYQKDVESGEQVLVGVNKFTTPGAASGVEVMRVDDSIRGEQIQKLNALKSARNNGEVQARLDTIQSVAIEGGNLMPHIISAVEEYATLGEVADVLRGVFGEHKG